MAESILVVEYEPRYTERVQKALSGSPWEPQFARDGEEALRLLESLRPRLIVLSSITPRVPTTELIRRIRGNAVLAATPILLTVSGYKGSDPVGDATRVGATDILTKPYVESDFRARVESMITGSSAAAAQAAAPAASAAATARKRTTEADLDKLLADTLSGVLPKKTSGGSVRVAPAGRASAPGSEDLERLMDQTLSGIDRRRSTSAAPNPAEASSQPVQPRIEGPTAPPVREASSPEPEPEPFGDLTADAEPKAPPVEVSKTDEVPTAATEDEEPGDGTRFGQYVLLDRIATGGMAEVWKARMRGVEGFQKTVAIKKILPHLSDNNEFIDMFVDEAKLAAQLSHNNIIHIYDLGKTNGAYYIAMEYVEGHDLRTIMGRAMDRAHPMPVELALFVASKVAAALDYAHRKRDFDDKELGLVHRDVSPQNVLISYEGDIKLCDFGIAKAASKASTTQAGALKGKLQYMSPEQAWGRSLDRRSDLFALGIVLFEMLAGRKLFSGDNEMSVLEQVREARLPSLPELNEDVSPEIEQIVLRALRKEPGERYQSAGEMARDLDQILYGFRPTPTSADLAIYMHRLYSEDQAPASTASAAPELVQEITKPRVELTAPAILVIPDEPVAEPVADGESTQVESSPVAEVVPIGATPVEAESAAAAEAPVEQKLEPQRQRSAVPFLMAAAVFLAVAAGAFAFFRSREAQSAYSPQVQQAAMTTNPGLPALADPIPPPAESEVAQQVAADLQTDDQAAIDAEVERRLAEARRQFEEQRQQQLAEQQKRLEEARAQQQSTPAAPPAEAAPARQTAESEPARRPTPPPAAVAEPPAAQPTTTVAQSGTGPQTQNPSAPVRQEAQPEPQREPRQEAPAVAEAPRTKEGDLIAAGTPGLIPAEVVRMRDPSYPPMARARRVEGSVLLAVLVSETGKVLDVRVIRGITPDLGFTHSAVEAVRSATFRPGSKDGVRVKSYKTISVSFKL